MSALAARTGGVRALLARHTLVRSLAIVVGTAIVLLVISDAISPYRDLQLADGAYSSRRSPG